MKILFFPLVTYGVMNLPWKPICTAEIDLLIRLLEWYWREQNDFYASGNLTIYYSPNQRKSEDFRGPDFFVVLGCERKDRKS